MNIYLATLLTNRHMLDIWLRSIWNPSINNVIYWFAGPMGQTNRQPSIWHSKYFFFIISFRLRALKTLYFHICNLIKKIIERVFAKNFARFCKKKNPLEHQTLGWRVVCPMGLHSKLRCFYLLSDVVKKYSIKTECSGGSVGSLLRSDVN